MNSLRFVTTCFQLKMLSILPESYRLLCPKPCPGKRCGESRQGAKLAKDQIKHPQKGPGTNGGVSHFKNQESSLGNHPSSDGKAAGDGHKPRTEFRAESKKGKEHWLLALVFLLTRIH